MDTSAPERTVGQRDQGHTVKYSREEKRLLKHAAYLRDVSVGELIRSAAIESATATVLGQALKAAA